MRFSSFPKNLSFIVQTEIIPTIIRYFTLFIVAVAVFSCGTLGGFDNISFPTTKRNLENAIDTFYAKNPNYLIPEKWKKYDDWKAKGYGFLDTRIFYFDSNPEEMYYVSFVGDDDPIHDSAKVAKIAIRSVFRGNSNWILEENIRKSEKNRIVKRFNDEIVAKLEEYTNTTSN